MAISQQSRAIVLALILIGAVVIVGKGTLDVAREEEDKEELRSDFLEFGDNVRLSNFPQSNNEPHIAINPTDPMNIVASCNDYGTPLEDAWLGFYTSVDGGESWTRGLIPGYFDPDNPRPNAEPLWGFKGTGDPVVAFDKDGTCYIAGITFYRVPLVPGRNSAIFVARSLDKGFNWEVNMVVTSVSVGTFHDKEWIAADPNTGDLYVTWTAFNFYNVASLMFSKSTDKGVTWSTPRVLSELRELELQVQGSYLAVDVSGTVHVTWIDYGENAIRYTSSSDEGNSWSQPRSVSPVEPLPASLPGGEYRTPTMPVLAVDNSDGPYGGSVYIAWPDYSNNNGDIFLINSRDSGQTWSNTSIVNNDNSTADQFFPAMEVSPNGWVHLVFYDKRNDAENDIMLEVYYAQSRDGGQNFNIQEPMTNQSFSGESNTFIGDYIGIAVNDTTAHAVWCDTRDGSESSPRTELYYGSIVFATGYDSAPQEADAVTGASE